MSWRTTLAGVLAALAVLATLPQVPATVRVIAGIAQAVALAFLGAVSRDHAAPIAPVCPLLVPHPKAGEDAKDAPKGAP